MPLARAALYEKGIDVLLAPTWDNSDEWVPTLRHTAKEGQVFVVGVTAFLRGRDVPRDLPGAEEIYGGAATTCRSATRPSSHRAARCSKDLSPDEQTSSPQTSTSTGSPPDAGPSTRPVTTPVPTSSLSPSTRTETIMSEFPAIGHVALTVNDLAVSRPWYERLVSAEAVLDESIDGGFHHTVFMISGTPLGLHQHPETDSDAAIRARPTRGRSGSASRRVGAETRCGQASPTSSMTASTHARHAILGTGEVSRRWVTARRAAPRSPRTRRGRRRG